MVDNITWYTDRILAEIQDYFGDEPRTIKRKGKASSVNFLPILHHLYIKIQQQNEGVKTDFTDPDKIVSAFSNYVRLIAEINNYTALAPTKANYCAFLGITTGRYARLLQDSPQDIRDALQYGEDYMTSVLQGGGMTGDLGSNATKNVLQTAGVHGFNQVTVKEASDIRATERRMLSPEELNQKLKMITSGGK